MGQIAQSPATKKKVGDVNVTYEYVSTHNKTTKLVTNVGGVRGGFPKTENALENSLTDLRGKWDECEAFTSVRVTEDRRWLRLRRQRRQWRLLWLRQRRPCEKAATFWANPAHVALLYAYCVCVTECVCLSVCVWVCVYAKCFSRKLFAAAATPTSTAQNERNQLKPLCVAFMRCAFLWIQWKSQETTRLLICFTAGYSIMICTLKYTLTT